MAKDVVKKDPAKTDEDWLEEALEDSFPASDPPAVTAPSRHVGKFDKKKGEGDSGQVPVEDDDDDNDQSKSDDAD
jgi:hypothetical protein